MDEKQRKKWDEAGQRAELGDFDNIVLKDGSNAVRIIDLNFEETYVHYIKDTENETRKVVCPAGLDDRKNAVDICPVCCEFADTKDSDIRPQHRYLFNAVQGELVPVKKAGGGRAVKIVLDNVVKIFDVGNMIFKQIYAINDDDEFPDVDKINLKITRKGSKKKTEYIVMPSSKETSLPDDLTEPIDIADLAKLTPVEEINEMLGLETDETTDMEDDDTAAEEEKPKTKPKTISKPKPKDEEKKEKEKDEDEDLENMELEELED